MHDHSCEEHDCSSDWSLYKHIDLPKVQSFCYFFFQVLDLVLALFVLLLGFVVYLTKVLILLGFSESARMKISDPHKPLS